MAQPKDSWDKAQILGTWAITLAIALVGWWVNTSLKESDARARMFEMAVGILQEKPTPEEGGADTLRDWAVQVMEENSGVSGVSLTSEQLEKLREHRLVGAFPCTLY